MSLAETKDSTLNVTEHHTQDSEANSLKVFSSWKEKKLVVKWMVNLWYESNTGIIQCYPSFYIYPVLIQTVACINFNCLGFRVAFKLSVCFQGCQKLMRYLLQRVK